MPYLYGSEPLVSDEKTEEAWEKELNLGFEPKGPALSRSSPPYCPSHPRASYLPDILRGKRLPSRIPNRIASRTKFYTGTGPGPLIIRSASQRYS